MSEQPRQRFEPVFLLTVQLTNLAQRSTYLRTVVSAHDIRHSEPSNTDLGEGL
jgi:hypothetical protein